VSAPVSQPSSPPEPSPPAVAVRLARPDEYAAAGDLVADTYRDEGFVRGPYLAVLRDAARRAAAADLLVAVAPDGALLGTVTYAAGGTPYADTAESAADGEFRMLAVAPTARRRGVGEALVRACIDRARAQGKRRLVLSSDAAMRAAHRLYERLGFAYLPDRDWSPEPGVQLRVYALPVAPDATKPVPLAPIAAPETTGSP
jgi:GNAT superfamily N-acetyltransferase